MVNVRLTAGAVGTGDLAILVAGTFVTVDVVRLSNVEPRFIGSVASLEEKKHIYIYFKDEHLKHSM